MLILDDKGKLFDELFSVSELMNKEVVIASLDVEIPEDLSIEDLYCFIVSGLFLPDDELFEIHVAIRKEFLVNQINNQKRVN